MEKYDIHKDIKFKTGVYKLNDNANFDFQLNRVINWDGGRYEDIEKISHKIHNSDDWKRELIALGDTAITENRIENAISYYRMSEFFMYDGDSDKKKYYEKATKMFYEYFEDFFKGDNPIVKQYSVPCENVYLPVMYVMPNGESKGTILLHGGNDSYFEEFFFPMLYLREKGYEVYLFEGPGQGGVIRLQGKHFTHEWEKPVKAVLNYFNLDDVTIIGASLGGYLAPRAAAFDNRIKRVVAWSVFPCFMDVIMSGMPKAAQRLLNILIRLKCRAVINLIFNTASNKEPELDWGLKHGCYAYEAKDAYEYAKKLMLYDLAPVADMITQDILILGANQDHFIDYKMVGKEINMLKNVRSLTFRLMTDKEQAQNHCNCGNSKLVFDTICNWIEMTYRRE